MSISGQVSLNLNPKRKRDAAATACTEPPPKKLGAAEKQARRHARMLADPVKRKQHEAYLYRQRINAASKDQDVGAAITAFDECVAAGHAVTASMFNQVLALCSTFQRTEPAVRIFAQMEAAAERSAAQYKEIAAPPAADGAPKKKMKLGNKVVITESTVTALVKLHAGAGDFDRAETLMRTMQERFNLTLKARTYTPVIVACCAAFCEANALRLVRESIAATDKDPSEEVFRALIALLSARAAEPAEAAERAEVAAVEIASASPSGSVGSAALVPANTTTGPPLLSAWSAGTSAPSLHRATERLYRVLNEMVEIVLRIDASSRGVLTAWFASVPATAHLTERVALEHRARAAAAGGAGAVAAPWRWRVTASTVDADGLCAVTGRRLRQIQLSSHEHRRCVATQRDYRYSSCESNSQLFDSLPSPNLVDSSSLCSQVESCLIAANSGRRDKAAWKERRQRQFAEFKEWLQVEQLPENGGKFACFIDGANVGFFNQNHPDGGFSFGQVDAVVQHYLSRGLRPLVVLHNKYFKKPNAISAAWKARTPKVLFICAPGNNDDWYWLGGALYAPTLAPSTESAGADAPVRAAGAQETAALPWTGGRDGALFFSNDQMRDHHWMMLDDMKGRYFQKWRSSHQVHYTFKWSQGANQMGVIDPPKFSYRAQRTLPAAESGPLESASATAVGFHFPSTEDDTWLTAVPERVSEDTVEGR